MPYRRKGTYTKKRTYRKRGVNSQTRRIARQEAKKVVAKEIESKIYDGSTADVGVDYSGTSAVWSMTADPVAGTAMTQGISDYQYLGSKINPTHLTVRGLWTHVATENNMVRVILVQVIVSGTPTLANLLESVGNIRAPLSPYDRTYNDTYRVLADRMYTTNDQRPIVPFKIKVPGKKLRFIHFADGSGTVERGAIYLCAISDSAVASHPSIQFVHRMFYKDA